MTQDIASLISVLFASRTQAHIFHFQTTSFSVHKALNDYYDGIIDLTDGVVESYQGKYGIITNYSAATKITESASVSQIITYFTDLSELVDRLRKQIPQDTFIQNQIDEIVELISGTLYKLKFLN